MGVFVVPSWFQSNASWADVMHLAFRYLDVDSDGVLGPQDLQAHVQDGDKEQVQRWISKWRRSQFTEQSHGIGVVDFRWTLWSTCIRRVQHVDSLNPCALQSDRSNDPQSWTKT